MTSSQADRLSSIPSTTGGIARLACTRLSEFGKDAGPIIAQVGASLEQVYDDSVRLEVSKEIRILDLAAEELGDELFGFHLGRNFDLREIGLLYYVIASSERLADAIRNAERYCGIMNDGVCLHFSPGRSHGRDCSRLRQRRPALGPPSNRVLAGDGNAHLPADH